MPGKIRRSCQFGVIGKEGEDVLDDMKPVSFGGWLGLVKDSSAAESVAKLEVLLVLPGRTKNF